MRIKECIALIKEMKEITFINKKDKDRLLKTIIPAVNNLRNGKELMKDIKEKVNINEFDQAASLLKKAARHSKFWPLNDAIRSDFSAVRIFILTFIGSGIFLFIFWHGNEKHKTESENWPSTTGIVINSIIQEHSDEDDYITGYSPVIEYSYTVFGKSYKSNKFSITQDIREYDRADSIIKQHPANSLITVYYHPEKHKMSVLKNEFDPFLYFPIIAGYVLILIGFTILIMKILIEIRKVKRLDKTTKNR